MMKIMKSKLLSFLILILLIPLLFSVAKSGYGYQFDTDELHHANLVYLLYNGHIPYRDIYNSFYTPLFEWVLLPVFAAFGFSFKTIQFSRFIMIIFYAIRVGSLYILIRTLWNKRAALLFIPLLVLDPFAVLSSFQIRTDNFMLMLYSVGLAILSVGIVKQKTKIVHWGLCALGCAALSFPKIVPSVAIISAYALYLQWKKSGFKGLVSSVGFAAAPILAFALYGVVTGGISEMITQLILEAKTAYSVFRAPLPFGAVFYPNNMWIYGTMGKPATWIYIWVLPLLGAGGLFSFLISIVHKKTLQKQDVFGLMLSLTLLVNFISLFTLPVVFIQHYLLINWLYALFAAVLLDELLQALESRPWIFTTVSALFLILYAYMVNVSFTYNIARGTIRGQETIDGFQKRLSQIDPNESVFPNFLFRPPVYPVPFGYYIGNVPEPILNRLPDIPDMLENKKIQKLLFDEYTFSLMPERIRTYITDHYYRVAGDPELMIRK